MRTYDWLECLEFKSIRISFLRVRLINHPKLPFDCLTLCTLSLGYVDRFLAGKNTLDDWGGIAQDQVV